MRIERISVANFRGIREADIDGLAAAPVVTLSGRNGAGKSLLLEAVAILWRQRVVDPPALVGPWGNDARIEVALSLEHDEWQALAEFGRAFGGHPALGDPPALLEASVTLNKGGAVTWPESAPWMQLVRNQAFQREHPFSHIDLLPADRAIPRGESPTVTPQLLGEEQAEAFRVQVVESVARVRQQVQLAGVQPFLASLDYLELIAEREGSESPKDFSILSDNFHRATGKKIHRPRLDPARGASIEVETEAGTSHGVDQLSSGEQEVLGLMYYVRRLSARGGVLLVDEPELHLHPALQRSLFEVLEDVAERAQVWIATHSPKLVAAPSLDAVLHMVPASPEPRNQLTRASDEAARTTLLDDLGMNPVDLLQNDIIVVVEGPTDVHFLSMIFPIELGRALIYQAGNASGVERVSATLMSEQGVLPWLCIRDRDLMSDERVQVLQQEHPNIYVWPRRTLENHFIAAELISTGLKAVGRDMSEAAVLERLAALAEEEKDEVLIALVEHELDTRYPMHIEKSGDRFEDLRRWLKVSEHTVEAKLSDVENILEETRSMLEARWSEDWPSLVQGKRVLARFLSDTPFRTLPDLIACLAHACREHPDVTPEAIRDLRGRLTALVG